MKLNEVHEINTAANQKLFIRPIASGPKKMVILQATKCSSGVGACWDFGSHRPKQT
jgi:hypothetical protein